MKAIDFLFTKKEQNQYKSTRMLTGSTRVNLKTLLAQDKHSKYKAGDVAQWSDGMHRKRPDGKWEKIGENELPNSEKTSKISVRVSSDIKDGKAFRTTLLKAKSTQDPKNAWRVDTTSHGDKDYLHKVLVTTPDGSCACVTKDGDIISVCTNRQTDFNKDRNYNGSEVLKEAVKNGGLKLDSFDGNFSFYVRNGFKPVSWCKFDEEYAPEGWRKNRDSPESVVFFKYVGSDKMKRFSEEPNDFYAKVPMSKDYGTAQKIRDREVHHADTRRI